MGLVVYASVIVLGPLFVMLAITLWVFRPARKAERDKSKPDS